MRGGGWYAPSPSAGRAWMKVGSSAGKLSGSGKSRKRDMIELRGSDQGQAKGERGLYVTEMIGSGLNPVTGDYSRGASGFLIEDGRIVAPVAEITIAGNLIDMYRNLSAANDLEFRRTVNVPTLRIEGMTVAGA